MCSEEEEAVTQLGLEPHEGLHGVFGVVLVNEENDGCVLAALTEVELLNPACRDWMRHV